MSKDLYNLLTTVRVVDVIATLALLAIIVGVFVTQRRKIRDVLEHWRKNWGAGLGLSPNFSYVAEFHCHFELFIVKFDCIYGNSAKLCEIYTYEKEMIYPKMHQKPPKTNVLSGFVMVDLAGSNTNLYCFAGGILLSLDLGNNDNV